MLSSTKTNRTTKVQPEAHNFVFQSGLPYADKDEYTAKALVFDIKAISFEPNGGFEGQDRWVLRVLCHDGRGEQLLSLGSNAKRDEQLHNAKAFIEKKGPIKNSRLKLAGKAYFLENSQTS